MRTGNTMDGMYFFLLILPFALSLWVGHVLRRKIIFNIHAEHSWNQNLTLFLGTSVQVLVSLIGISVGFLLTILI